MDLLRARKRLRRQLYMPLHHIQVLLTVEVRQQLMFLRCADVIVVAG